MKSLHKINQKSSRHFWKNKIVGAWVQTTEAFLQVGSLLIESKESLDHGDFLKLIEKELPFSPRTSQMLSEIRIS